MDAPALRPAAPEEAAEPAAAQPPGPPAPSGSSPRHARRLPPVRRWTGTASHAIARWARRPAGRLVVPGLVIAGLIGVTGTAGAYLVPSVARHTQAPAPSGSDGTIPAAEPPTAAPAQPPLPTATTTAGTGGREAAKLGPLWAQPLSAKVQIPQVALEAYGYAAWVLEQTQPSCHLSWTTLAAIGKVESNHGRVGGATLTPDGRAYPPIIGPPLDGKDNRKLVPDTDHGMLDNDVTYDRAIGPMQFIPSTWQIWATDADNSGTADPHDIDDSALAAARYLCANNRDLNTAVGWWSAVRAYNDVQVYAQSIFDAANEYGQRSRG